MMMRVLAGQRLSGATTTEVDELGGLGRPVWDPVRLLADLEMRLGLGGEATAPVVRVQSYSARMAASVGADRFYARSYRRDPIGTAAALIGWRDELVLGGWEGDRIPGGGERLDALAELEMMSGPSLHPGVADRVRALEGTMDREPLRAYEVLTLVDDPALWPARWRRVFEALERSGTRVERAEAPAPAATADSDLGRVQALFLGARPPTGQAMLSGDGSLVLLRAGTGFEAASAVAALLRRWGTGDTAVVRGNGTSSILDAALVAQGLAPLGAAAPSRWRPALQILPLAVELLFEPKDPYRILDLCTVPASPFQQVTRRALGRALSQMPGVGGRAWLAAKEVIRERILAAELGDPASDTAEERARRAGRQLALVESWIEAPGHDPVSGAPREALAAAAHRVAEWARGRLSRGPDDPVVLAAYREAQDFAAAIAADPRASIGLVAARQLVIEVSGAVAVATSDAAAGRLDLADDPVGLRCHRDTVVWWDFVDGTQGSVPARWWRRAEEQALAAAGVLFVDPSVALAAQAESWRAPILLARRRAILVVPGSSAGVRNDPHPLWSEILALGGARDQDVAAVTVTAEELLGGTGRLDSPAVETVSPLALPAPRHAWRLPAGLVVPSIRHSASSIEMLIGCPLRFVFSRAAGLRASWLSSVPELFVLAGTVGHRLVEELHREGLFAGPVDLLAVRAGEIFDALLAPEASPLLLAGASFERHQIRAQLCDAVVALARALAARGLGVLGVEVSTEAAWSERTLEGRIDLLVGSEPGVAPAKDDGEPATLPLAEAVIDLKWGQSRYRDRLAGGRAIQLATYAHLRQEANGRVGPVAAAYFSLSRGELLATSDLALPGRRAIDGPAAAGTWLRVERTALAVEAALARGVVAVTGVVDAPALAATLGDGDFLDAPLGDACTYCEHDALCGRRWGAAS